MQSTLNVAAGSFRPHPRRFPGSPRSNPHR